MGKSMKIFFVILFYFVIFFLMIITVPHMTETESYQNTVFETKIKKIEYTIKKKIQVCKDLNNKSLIYKSNKNKLYTYINEQENIIICQKSLL